MATTDHVQISPDEALTRLIEGNNRFCSGHSSSDVVTQQKLDTLAKGQAPYVTILCCSDSRVPPERVFDAGLGELFVVRVAGNVFSPEIAGSLQYAGAHPRTPFFVVLGHEGCGAVQAAMEARDRGVQHLRHIQILVDSILPGLPPSDPSLDADAELSRAVESNVRWTVRQICDAAEPRARLKEGGVKIVGAIYELASARVRRLPDE